VRDTPLLLGSALRHRLPRMDSWRTCIVRVAIRLECRVVDLVGRCFNYLCFDHVAARCSFPLRCLRCHREGHSARSYKRPRSPEASGPPHHHCHPQLVAVVNPRPGDVALAAPANLGNVRGSTSPTSPGASMASTPSGSLSHHVLPSPPLSPPPLPSDPPQGGAH
jgi:hypothetical protein